MCFNVNNIKNNCRSIQITNKNKNTAIKIKEDSPKIQMERSPEATLNTHTLNNNRVCQA